MDGNQIRCAECRDSCHRHCPTCVGRWGSEEAPQTKPTCVVVQRTCHWHHCNVVTHASGLGDMSHTLYNVRPNSADLTQTRSYTFDFQSAIYRFRATVARESHLFSPFVGRPTGIGRAYCCWKVKLSIGRPVPIDFICFFAD